MTAMAYADTRQEIEQAAEEEARQDAERKRWRALLKAADALLGRAERANLHDAERISGGLRSAIVELAEEVGTPIPPPRGPQKAVDRLFDLQDELLGRLHPEYASDFEEAGRRWAERGSAEEPDDPGERIRKEALRLLGEGPAGFAWSDIANGETPNGREQIQRVLVEMEAEGLIREVSAPSGGHRYLPAQACLPRRHIRQEMARIATASSGDTRGGAR